MQTQLLDANDIAVGILSPLHGSARNTDLDAALCTAVNEWQLEQVGRTRSRGCAPA